MNASQESMQFDNDWQTRRQELFRTGHNLHLIMFNADGGCSCNHDAKYMGNMIGGLLGVLILLFFYVVAPLLVLLFLVLLSLYVAINLNKRGWKGVKEQKIKSESCTGQAAVWRAWAYLFFAVLFYMASAFFTYRFIAKIFDVFRSLHETFPSLFNS
jgi:hypothetical protein